MSLKWIVLYLVLLHVFIDVCLRFVWCKLSRALCILGLGNPKLEITTSGKCLSCFWNDINKPINCKRTLGPDKWYHSLPCIRAPLLSFSSVPNLSHLNELPGPAISPTSLLLSYGCNHFRTYSLSLLSKLARWTGQFGINGSSILCFWVVDILFCLFWASPNGRRSASLSVCMRPSVVAEGMWHLLSIQDFLEFPLYMHIWWKICTPT